MGSYQPMTDSEAVRSARPSKAVKTQPSANHANPELTGEVAALRSIFDSRPSLVTFALLGERRTFSGRETPVHRRV